VYNVENSIKIRCYEQEKCGKLGKDYFSLLFVGGLLYNKSTIRGSTMLNSVSEIAQFWSKALKLIEDRLGEKQLFDSFFADTYINRINGNNIEIVTSSQLAKSLLNTKYLDVISGVVNDLTETNFNLIFVLNSEIEEFKPAVSEPVKVQYFKDSKINPNFTFDSFVVGSFNREANQASVLIASNPGKMFNPLFLYSQSGLGKTHLVHAIANYIKFNSKPGCKILYTTGQDFIEEYVKFARGEKESESLKDFICSYDVFIVDDIQMLSGKIQTQSLFFQIFESLHNNNKQIILTSDRQPNEIKDLEERLITRFQKGLLIKIDKPDQNTCVEILKKKITSRGLDLSRFDENVLIFIADKFSKDIRELEGALNRLIFYTINLKQVEHISLDVAVEAISSLISTKELDSELSEQKIINVVADYYNLTPSQLTGKIRTGQIALARHLAMYLIRNTLDVSLKKIGDIFGGKDHTTVMSGIQKVDVMLKTDEGVKAAVFDLKKRLKVK